MRDFSFGDRLSTLRQECGYSQFQLASLIGVSDKAVSKWETGASKPRMKTCQRLASVLGVDLGDLFSQDGLTSSWEGYGMNKKKLWAAAEERLYFTYGTKPDISLINRFKTEKNFLRDTEAIVLFAAIARVRHVANEHHTLINVRSMVNGSFTAWLMGATVINPLPAHTYCPVCHKLHFHPEVEDSWDLAEEICECGSKLIREGHNLPFETYMDNVKANFCSIDCSVSSVVVSEAWRELLAFIQTDYRCDRFVFRQTDETGYPGCFSRLYLHPGNNGLIYHSIDEVPEISYEMMMRNRNEDPSILLLDSSSDSMKCEAIPSIGEILTPVMLRKTLKKNCAQQYYLSDISTFHELVQAQAASHATIKEGCDLIQFAADHGLNSYTELPLTREAVWLTVVRATNGNAGIAGDILYNIRLGKYARGISECDTELMIRMGLPEWFPEYALQVLYIFPKSHCIDFAYRDLLEAWNENKTVV